MRRPLALAFALAVVALVVVFAVRGCGIGGTTGVARPSPDATAGAVSDDAADGGETQARRVARAERPSVGTAAPSAAAEVESDGELTVVVTAVGVRDGLASPDASPATPIAGAVVRVLDLYAHDPSKTTDDRGEATFRVAAERDWYLYVQALGRTHWSQRVWIDKGVRRRVEVSLEPAATVRLRVVDDATGAPVSGAHAVLVAGGIDPAGTERSDGEAIASAVTGEDGRAALDGAPVFQPSTLTLSAAGRAGTRRFLVPRAPGPFDVEVRLAPGGTIAGVVLDAGGAPVRGRCVDVSPQGGGPASPTMTDAAGRFRVDGLDLDGRYDVVAERGTWEHCEPVRGVAPVREPAGDGVVLRPPRAGRVVVRVRDADGNDAAIDRRDVVLTCADCGAAVHTVEPGVALDVPSGAYTVEVAATTGHPGGTARVEVPPGGDATADVRLERATPLEVRVRDEAGAPLGDADVEVCDGDGERRELGEVADGTFRTEGLVAGTWTVRVSDGSNHPDVVRVVTTPCDPVEIVLPRYAVVEVRLPPETAGRSYDARMQHPATAFDGETPDGWQEDSTVNTCEPGPHVVDDVTPGRARLFLAVEGFLPWTADFDIAPGERKVVDVGPLDPGVRVSGRIVDAEGHPVGGATVRVEGVRTPWFAREARSRRDGAFGPLCVEPGRAVLGFAAPGLAQRLVAIDAGPGLAPLDVRMSRGGTIDLVAVDASGVPVPGRSVRAVDPAVGGGVERYPRTWTTDHRGRASLVVSPGTWSVRVDGAGPVDAEVREGGATPVRVVVGP